MTTDTRQSNLRRVAVKMAPITLAVQVFSFVSSVALASVLGATKDTDAYYLALSVPFIVYGILLGAIRLGAIPALTRLLHQKPEAFGEGSSELTTGVLIAGGALAAVTTIGAVLAMGSVIGSGERNIVPLARLLALELAPYGVMGAAAGILGAILTVRGRMIAPIAVLAFEPAIKTVLLLVLGHAIGVQSLVMGNLVGSAAGVAYLAWLLRHDGVGVRFVRPSSSPFVREVLLFSLPLLLSQTVLYINPLVDRAMASVVGPGSVTQFELGSKIFGVPAALLGSTLIAPITATWSARYQRDGWSALSGSLRRAVAAILAVVPPLVVIGVLLRHPLVSALYHGGAYSAHDISRTADVVALLLLGLPAQVIIVALAALFVVRGRTLFMLCIAVVNVVLNVTLNLWLRGPLGVGGMALSTSLTYTILMVAYARGASRRFGDLQLSDLLAPATRALASSVVIAGFAVGGLALLHPSSSRWSSAIAVVILGVPLVALHVAGLALSGNADARQLLGQTYRWLLHRPWRTAGETP